MNTSPDQATAPLAAVRRAASAASTADAARALAAAGVPVFPCVQETKRPLTTHGFLEATTDPGRLVWWWRRHPTANLAIPTGAVSGIEVVDVDVHGRENGYPAFNRAQLAGLVGGWGLMIRTPSGGVHAYFAHRPGTEQRSWQCPSAHVDFRGDGGYVVVPPSVVAVPDVGRRPYSLAVTSQHVPEPVDAVALRAFLDPPKPFATSSAAPVAGADPDRLAAWVAAHPEGGRNAGLFWAACRMVEHGFDFHSTLGALGPAAAHAGLPEREAETTIRSAFRRTHARDPALNQPAPGSPSPALRPRGRPSMSSAGDRRRPPEVVTP